MMEKESQPLVSVVMCVYNTPPHQLKAALLSILEQTYPRIEFIIIDDASTDQQTVSLLTETVKNDKKIRYYRNKYNQGLTHSLNLALSYVHGDYICRMDADDISVRNRIEIQLEALKKYPSLGVVASNVKIIDEEGNVIGKKHYPEDHNGLKWQLLFGNSICHSSAFIRRSVLDASNIKYDISLKYAQDYALWSKLINETQFTVVKETLLSIRRHKKSISNSNKSEQNKIAEIISARNLSAYFPDHSPISITEFRNWYLDANGNVSGKMLSQRMKELSSLLKKFYETTIETPHSNTRDFISEKINSRLSKIPLQFFLNPLISLPLSTRINHIFYRVSQALRYNLKK